MAERALAKKMKLRPRSRVAILNAPEGYRKELAPLPKDVELVGRRFLVGADQLGRLPWAHTR